MSTCLKCLAFLILGIALFSSCSQDGPTVKPAPESNSPERLFADPSALEKPEELELLPGQTSTIYRAEEGGWQFNLHSYVTFFEDQYWAMWSSSRVDEDSSNQILRYARSQDGHQWDENGILVDDPDGPDGPIHWIARGIFVLDGRLTALGARIGGKTNYSQEHTGLVWPDLKLIRFEWNGSTWEEKGVFLENCMNNFPPRPLGEGLFMTCRDGQSQMYTARSAGLEGTGWKVEEMPIAYPVDRLSEPSWYVDPGGVTHLIFRDQRRSRYLLHSLSKDNGGSWTVPVITNYPDATSKNFTGRLSSGLYYLINNPNQKGRDPLAISFSEDGWTFSKPRALRKNPPARRFSGRAKPDRSVQYPHAIENGGSLWVIYATNKEDIEISEFQVSDLEKAVRQERSPSE